MATSQEKAVFGHDVTFNQDGTPIEKGIGALPPKVEPPVELPVEPTSDEADAEVFNDYE